MKQREAVYQAICQVTGQDEFDTQVELSKDERAEVQKIVSGMLVTGQADFSDDARKKYDTEQKVATYTSGLVSNWLRKDKRLNGNISYVPKNPGSRAGNGDPMLRELRKLKKLHTGTDKEAEIDGYITARQEEIKVEKAKAIEINTSLIPEALRHLVSYVPKIPG